MSRDFLKQVATGLVSAAAAIAIILMVEARRQPVPRVVPPMVAEPRFEAVVRGAWPSFVPATGPSPALERVAPEIRIVNASIPDAFEQISKATGVPIYVDRAALAKAGLGEQVVKFHIGEMTARRAIERLVDHLRIGSAPPENTIASREAAGVVRISTAAQLAWDTYLQVYDVRDLLLTGSEFYREADNIGFKPTTVPTRNSFQPSRLKSVDDLEAQLKQLIQYRVDPTSWYDNGGSSGGVSPFAGRLIISQTPENHQRISFLLESLRAGSRRVGTARTTTAPSTAPVLPTRP